MNVWFARANGETLHNNQSTALYVQGEPPRYPEVEFDHTAICLREGFARIGWPASGDLREAGWQERAVAAYGPRADANALRYLQQFASIRVGDLMVLPAGKTIGHCHIGLVEPAPCDEDSKIAYFYYYDVAKADWFENAHRVNVRWAKSGPKATAFDLNDLGGGVWRRAFASVKSGAEEVVVTANRAGLT